MDISHLQKNITYKKDKIQILKQIIQISKLKNNLVTTILPIFNNVIHVLRKHRTSMHTIIIYFLSHDQ